MYFDVVELLLLFAATPLRAVEAGTGDGETLSLAVHAYREGA